MRILEDGSVEISRRHKRTGAVQTKIVQPKDLPSYGVPYSKYLTELEAYRKIQTGPEPTKKEEKTQAAETAVNLLESIYTGGKGEKSLAFGEEKLGGRAAGVAKGVQMKIAPGTFPESTRLNTYKRTLESIRPMLARAAGDVGNLALQEQIMAGKGLPDEQSTPEEATSLFISMRQKLGLKPLTEKGKKRVLEAFKTGKLSEQLGIVSPETGPLPPTAPEPTAPPAPGMVPTQSVIPNKKQRLSKIWRSGLFGPAPMGVDIAKQSRTAQALRETPEKWKKGEHFMQAPNLPEFFKRLVRQTVPAATEVSSMVLAPELSKILGFKTAGAAMGGARGLTTPEEMTKKKRAVETGKQAVGGWAFAAFLEALPKIPGLFKGKPPDVTTEDLSAGLATKAEGIRARSEAVKKAVEAGKTVDGNIVYDRLDDWAQNRAKVLGPNSSEAKKAIKYVKNMKPVLKGQQIDPADAQVMWDEAKSGFTASGKAQKTFEAGYYRALKDGLRQGLDKTAKGWEKATATIHKGYEQEKILRPVRMGEERKVIREGLKEAPAPIPEFLKKYGKKAAETAGMLWLLEKLGITRKLGFGD